MELRNGKTILWVPREAFESVEKFWKPEFTWIPLPVDRSLPPDRIAFIQTNGPVSPLPPPPTHPKTPLSPLAPHLSQTPLPSLLIPLPRTARTPAEAGFPLLEPASFRVGRSDYFGGCPEPKTAITAGFSPDDSDRPSTPSTATEPGSPATPSDVGSRHESRTKRQLGLQTSEDDLEVEHQLFKPSALLPPSKAGQPSSHASSPWKMVDHRDKYRAAHPGVKQASWKRRSGKREVKMNDRWQTYERDEAHWTGSKEGFAVRLDVNLEMEVEIKGFVNGDITLSAEALYVSSPRT